MTKQWVWGVLATVLGTAAGAQQPGSRGLEGTWLTQVTLRDCASGAPTAPPFFSLLTFAQGGTLVETTSAPGFVPSVRGPAHGSWMDTGNGTYRASMLAMITINGTLTRGQVIRQQIRMGSSGNDFASDAALTFLSPTGQQVGSGCARAVAARFE